jgi:KDO2-lipid IV(A) lauroyltransferase
VTGEAALADVREGGTWTARQRLKNDLVHALVRLGVVAASRLPRRVVLAACRALGLAAWLALPHERARARRRLDALACAPGAPRASVARAFVRAGELLADTVALLDPREPAGRTLAVDAESRESLRAAFAEGRGVVFVTAHLGPWERMAALLAAEGFPVATVARESYDPRLTRLYDRLRAPRGVRAIYRGRSDVAFAVLRELAAGRAVGFLVDLPGRVPSIPCAMLGEERPFPVGPLRIALARRAAVVVGTATGGRVTIARVPTGDLAPGPAGERDLAARLAGALGLRIAAAPADWLGLFA